MGWVVNATPRPLYLRERPGTHCTGTWVGPRAVPDRLGKPRPPPGFDPRTAQPVASRYTSYAIQAQVKDVIIIIKLLYVSVHHKYIRGNGGIAPCILNLGINKGEW